MSQLPGVRIAADSGAGALLCERVKSVRFLTDKATQALSQELMDSTQLKIRAINVRSRSTFRTVG